MFSTTARPTPVSIQRVGTVIRLTIVGVFVAVVAAIVLSSNMPLDHAVSLHGTIVAALLGFGALARYQKQAALALLDTQRLYQPNEVVLLAVLRYVQLGAAAVVLALVARSVFL